MSACTARYGGILERIRGEYLGHSDVTGRPQYASSQWVGHCPCGFQTEPGKKSAAARALDEHRAEVRALEANDTIVPQELA